MYYVNVFFLISSSVSDMLVTCLSVPVMSPCDEKTALANLQQCIQEVREWLRENFLLLNENKTEVVIFGKDTTEKPLQIGKSVISSRSTSLGCILDSKLNMSQHVSRVCKSANYYITLH